MAHFGHANAIRQARELGAELGGARGVYVCVGVHSDADIERHKGPPVMNERERYEAVRGCKWVDEVVEGAPYVTQLATLDEYKIDFCVHGEDITRDEHGNDCYAAVKAAGRYKTIRRAQGVSSTDLVGRMLLLTKEHHERRANDSIQSSSPYTKMSPFLPSSRMLAAFTAGCRAPTSDDVIVYVDGAFDLFNVAHVSALRKAKELGTYLIVGVHDDETVNRNKGLNYPLQSLHERALSVLATRYADEVITGAPWVLDEGTINTLRISVVASGSVSDFPDMLRDPYAVPKRMGILKTFESDYPQLTTQAVVRRVLAHRTKFEERNRRKERGEIAFIEQKKREREEHEAALQSKKKARPADDNGGEEEGGK